MSIKRTDGDWPSDQDYEAIETAVLDTTKGRWFLAEHSRRQCATHTFGLLDALQKLQNALGRRAPASRFDEVDLAGLAAAIAAARDDIASAGGGTREGGCASVRGPRLYAAIAEAAGAAAEELMTRAEALQGTAAAVHEGADDSSLARLDSEIGGLRSLAWRLKAVSQRAAKAMDLLAHLDERIAGLADAALPASPPVQPAPERLKFFQAEEDLFAPPEGQAATPASQAAAPPTRPAASYPGTEPGTTVREARREPAKQRIIVIRRPAGEAGDIPLEQETDSSALA